MSRHSSDGRTRWKSRQIGSQVSCIARQCWMGQHLQISLSVYMLCDCTAAAVIQLIIQQCTSMSRNIAMARYSYRKDARSAQICSVCLSDAGMTLQKATARSRAPNLISLLLDGLNRLVRQRPGPGWKVWRWPRDEPRFANQPQFR